MNRSDKDNAADDWEDGAQEPEFKPLTREEAQQWRASQPRLSLWMLVGVQWLVGIGSAVLAWVTSWSVWRLTERKPAPLPGERASKAQGAALLAGHPWRRLLEAFLTSSKLSAPCRAPAAAAPAAAS